MNTAAPLQGLPPVPGRATRLWALGCTVLKLPSTSPANAGWSCERKRAAWCAAFEQAGLLLAPMKTPEPE